MVFWHTGLRNPLSSTANFFAYDVLRLPKSSLLDRYASAYLTGYPLLRNTAWKLFVTQAVGNTIEDFVERVYHGVAGRSSSRYTDLWKKFTGFVFGFGPGCRGRLRRGATYQNMTHDGESLYPFNAFTSFKALTAKASQTGGVMRFKVAYGTPTSTKVSSTKLASIHWKLATLKYTEPELRPVMWRRSAQLRPFLPPSMLGSTEPEMALHIGAVKSNIGHGGAVACIGALLRVLLTLQDTIPKHVGIKNELNPSFPDLVVRDIKVPFENTPYARPEGIPGRCS
ncbi:hypothetical protein PMIN06_004219 [Paraphaeosphaeria minitans]|uniref:Beta-ketoacyl synthase C-terminal domain-containing protein n=1 Tax=Paraphaeosphaeria minitans TaxID=565426 RepID=A0A9P6GES1_9PLEO|nr:hypothetical protein PMIN01_07219 [Paraphaeosphaeria minitans]